VQRRRFLRTETPLETAVIIYIGLLTLRLVLDRSGLMKAWGFYASVMYLPLFWIVPTALRQQGNATPRIVWAKRVIALLVAIGGVIALGGVIEFILDVSLWPSQELIQRQGFPDMYIYGTHIRRVYFTFDSPATLANTLGLILPLALGLIVVEKRTWARIAAGLAAALMAACIIVTFSRGIWIATTFSLVSMGVLSSAPSLLNSKHTDEGKEQDKPSKRIWRNLLIVGGALLIIGLSWLLVTMLRSGQAEAARQNVVELSPTGYENVPIIHVEQNLIQLEPIHGHAEIQTWTLKDPLSGREDTRTVIYEHPPESGKVEVIYRVDIPETGALRFSIALSPEVWSPDQGDGASFEVYVADADTPTEGQFVFTRYVNPKFNPNDRRWRNFLVDLSAWAGDTVNLSLITTAGPAGDWAFDWAGWAEPQIVQIEPGYFAAAQTENAILRHTGSILDWTTDDTNLDRLAAWRLSLEAWLESPLWGQGLGSTGVAAMRTQPGQAWVTESQILKALVELGLPGLFVWGFLWFQIARVGYQAYRSSEEKIRRWILLGILISLLTIFVEGWVYQNLEAKQVNAYFWTLVGTLAFLVKTPSEGSHVQSNPYSLEDTEKSALSGQDDG